MTTREQILERTTRRYAPLEGFDDLEIQSLNAFESAAIEALRMNSDGQIDKSKWGEWAAHIVQACVVTRDDHARVFRDDDTMNLLAVDAPTFNDLFGQCYAHINGVSLKKTSTTEITSSTA